MSPGCAREPIRARALRRHAGAAFRVHELEHQPDSGACDRPGVPRWPWNGQKICSSTHSAAPVVRRAGSQKRDRIPDVWPHSTALTQPGASRRRATKEERSVQEALATVRRPCKGSPSTCSMRRSTIAARVGSNCSKMIAGSPPRRSQSSHLDSLDSPRALQPPPRRTSDNSQLWPCGGTRDATETLAQPIGKAGNQ